MPFPNIWGISQEPGVPLLFNNKNYQSQYFQAYKPINSNSSRLHNKILDLTIADKSVPGKEMHSWNGVEDLYLKKVIKGFRYNYFFLAYIVPQTNVLMLSSTPE